MSTNIKAALLIMLAMTFISCNDAIIKTMTESLGIGQVLLVRGSIACLLFIVILKIRKMPVFPRQALTRINIGRASCEMCATCCFITGLSLMPIATVSTLTWTSPILSTLLAAVILKENVIAMRWIAVFIGFIGIALVTDPFSGEFSSVMFLPLMAAAFVATRDIFTRRIPAELNSIYITLATLILVTCAGLIISMFDWRPIAFNHLVALCGSAVLLSCGFFIQINAVRMGELSFIAPFSYFGIIVAIILGIVFWQEYPTLMMLFGVVLIVISGITITLSQRKKRLRAVKIV